jgi:hypothetical protein
MWPRLQSGALTLILHLHLGAALVGSLILGKERKGWALGHPTPAP